MRPAWIAFLVPSVTVLSTFSCLTASLVGVWGLGGTATAAGGTTPAGPRGVVIAAAGDTMLGNTPDLPPRPGRYLSRVSDALAAPITFGNLEGTLTTATHSKCGSGSSDCFAFRVPPRYAGYLHDARFDVMSVANNHSHDFGTTGYRQTQRSLRRRGIAPTGPRGLITYLPTHRLRVAFVAFAPYPEVSNLLDLSTARSMIRNAAAHAAIVVVYMHAGAEGSDKQHVTRREEYAFGEDRGNPYRFAHMAVDSGADLVIASGPHVLRGMEIYKHRLIAYSLGDFASYHNFNTDGVLGLSGVLRARVGPKGWFLGGRFVSVKLDDAGRPSRDAGNNGAHLVARLSKQDFGSKRARLSGDGTIARPAA